MSQISDFFDSEVLPAVFDSIDWILPEFEFKRAGAAWVSSNRLRVTGGEGSKSGSVYVYPDRPHFIKDFSSGGQALVTYLQESPLHPVNSWIESVKYLADKIGVPVPKRTLSPEELERIDKANLKARILEEANDYFIECLSSNQSNIAKGSEAESHRKYLEGRGYAKLIRLPGEEFDPKKARIEVGFVPSQGALRNHLSGLGFTDSDLDVYLFSAESGGELKRLPSAVGSTHKLSIPFRDPVGRIKGFAFRTIDEAEAKKGMKYTYTPGQWRSKMLFNLRAIRRDKDLVIVEGLLDALYARGLGRENVVALGGTSLNEDQIKAVVKFGARSVTLCLDSDEAGEKATASAIGSICRSPEPLSVYVANLPPGFKDPDELIREKGLDAFDQVVRSAKAYPRYQVEQVAKKAQALKDKGNLFDKDRDQLLGELSSIGQTVRGSSELNAFTAAFEEVAPALGFSKENLNAEIERISEAQAKAAQRAEVLQVLEKAQALAGAGKESEAAEFLSKQSKQLNTGLLDTSYRSLLRSSASEAEITARIQSRPESVNSGLRVGDNDLSFPSGAITIIAAPTSHGKTTFLINTALNVVQAYPGKRVYLFSYEESQEDVLIKALNVYTNTEYSKNNRRSIQSYFREGTTKYFSQDANHFLEQKDRFFKGLVESQLFHVEYTNYNSEELIGAIRYLKKNTDVSAVFIDYMQLLRLPNAGRLSRQEELKQVCLDLKDCAVDTGLPIILGAQFNRTVTQMSAIHSTAIGEAGDIERIANLILGLWNRQFPELGPEEPRRREPKIYAQVLKSRDSAAGATEDFLFEGNTGKIENRCVELNINLKF